MLTTVTLGAVMTAGLAVGTGGVGGVGGAGAAAAAAAAAGLPSGFLLYEAKAKKPAMPWQKWEISDDLSAPLELNPCAGKPGAANRAAARTITYSMENNSLSEQVVLYRDEKSARAAMRTLRADLKRCAAGGKHLTAYSYRAVSTRIGDEGLRGGAWFAEGSVRYVVVRKGAALATYVRTGDATKRLLPSRFRPLVKDARAMAAKICRLPGACAPSRA
ncbi:hypothetical protein Misp02_09610 [Microtetraspora sp. NBRC 16547]|nr:hypothetical protein Misp02_09610 [Microtetraspora sp. NBRC 16547]